MSDSPSLMLIDPEQVRTQAECLFEPHDIVEVRCLPSRASTWHPASRLHEYAPPQGQNVYVGANPRTAIGGTKAEDVAVFRCLFVDIDGVTVEEAEARLSASGLPTPMLKIHSGGGVHYYWRLDEPLTDAAEWTSRQQAMIDLLGADQKPKDPPRIMRLASTFNHKRGVTSRILEADPSLRYSIGSFPSPTRRRKAVQASTSAQNGALPGLSNGTKQTLARGATQGDRNGAVFRAACDMNGNGVPPETAKTLLVNVAEPGAPDPFTEKEVIDAVDSAYSKPRTPARPATPGAVAIRVASGDAEKDRGGDEDGLVLEFSPGRGKGRKRIVARWGDEVLHVEDLPIASSTSRRKFVSAVADRDSRVDRAALDAELMRLSACPEELEPPPPELPPASRGDRASLLQELDEQNVDLLAETPPDILEEALALLRDPSLINRIVADFELMGIVGETELSLTTYIMGTSRLLPKPLSIIVQGLTSSGKSYVPGRVAGMFPAETVFKATDITPQALYYLPPGTLMHRFIPAGERRRGDDDQNAEATRALREMISEGEIWKVIPEKNPLGGMTTRRIWQPGPIAFIESTTLTQVFDEDRNRCLMLGTDESESQTKRIVLAQAARAEGRSVPVDRLTLVYHTAQRSLKRCDVIVPYASRIADAIPTQRQEARRAMPHFLSLIQAVALLHQLQRSTGPIHHGDRITASSLDYAVACKLAKGPLSKALGSSVPDAVARFGQRLIESMARETFTSNDATSSDPVVKSRGKANEYLRTLADVGVVECVEQGRGNKATQWRIVGDVPEAGSDWLPTIEEIEEAQP